MRLRHLLTLASALVVLLGAAVPDARMALLVITNWFTVVAVLVGIRRYRPPAPHPWWYVVVFIAFMALGNTLVPLTGHDSPAVLVVTSAGQLIAAATVPRLLAGAPNWVHRGSTGVLLDFAVLVVVTAVVAAEVAWRGLERHAEEGFPLVLVVAPVVDVVVVGLLLWIVLSRARLVPAVVLAVTAGFGSLAYDVLVTMSGDRVAGPGEPLQVLGAFNMLLFGLAALHPSMARLRAAFLEAQGRRASVQSLLLLPCALTPAALVVVTSAGVDLRVPLPVLGVATVLVVVATLLRALDALRQTERGAERDSLTGLLNRTGLVRRYAQLLASASAPASASGSSSTPTPAGWLLMVDLDDFKRVNDRHGHSHGDALLIAVADRLRAAVGHAGVVARHGGDEFIVLVDAARSPGLHDPARLVLDTLAAPLDVHGQRTRVGASVGVVPVHAGDDLERLLADADIAMYASKRNGKASASAFRPELREEVLRGLATAEGLRGVLADPPADGAGELRVHFQPIVDLLDGRVVAAEALVRWWHPERGLLAPDAFLHVAEQEGLGARLDRAVLDLALRRLRAWDDDGVALPSLSVNLGMSALCDPTLPDWVADAARRHGVPPGRLRLEITEHDELPEEDRIRAALGRLVGAGFTLSLDDFGVGYSSLSYLQRYPISLLKLDRSLVDHDDPAAQPLITAIAGLGRSLRLDLLAEGIETAEQRDALRRVGVRYGQGYHFARPLPPEEFAAYWRAGGAVAGVTPPAGPPASAGCGT